MSDLDDAVSALLRRRRLGGWDADPAAFDPADALGITTAVNARTGADLRVSDAASAASVRDLVDLGRLLGSPAEAAARGRGGDAIPLSRTQTRFLYAEQLAPGGHDNNVVLAFELAGRVDQDALAAALHDVVDRHPVLRAAYTWDDELGPVRTPGPRPDLEVVAESSAEPAEAAVAATADWWDDGLDLETGPPLRTRLVPLGPSRSLLCLRVHHIAYDGRSESVITTDLGAAYAARSAGQAPVWPPAAGYGDFVRWEQDMAADWVARDLPYWQATLADPPPPLLPAHDLDDAPRVEHGLRVPAEVVAGYTAAVRAAGAAPFSGLLHGVTRGLARAFDRDRLLLGTMSSGRFERVFDRVVGPFVNPVAVPLAAPGPDTGTWLRAATLSATKALRHSRAPFDEVARLLGAAAPPLVEVFATLQDPPVPAAFAEGVTIAPVLVPPPRTAMPLVVEAAPDHGGGWTLDAYARADAPTAAVLEQVLDEVARTIHSLSEKD
ncbi:condensation domain-containing protein [Actinokineospora sp. G85]|uniref:condensation domain-containing protein n=1 Tax=Actinokineospora sp. G85 TaxID=3406626 RepID=UPI003C75B2B5